MPRKDLSRRDASEFERYSLDHILENEKNDQDDTRYLSVEEAVNDKSVYKVNSSRDVTRVLFISRDESLLNPTKQSLDGYTDISDLFDEVHILILRKGIKTKHPVLRVADNVWLYTANDRDSWWRTPFAGKKLAEEQLVFAEGFRPDLIVARDPFESSVLAIMLGRKYNRPVQIHVLEDFSQKAFLKKDKHNFWRSKIANFTIKRVASVRASTRMIYDFLQKKFSIKDLDVLPRFNNYESLINIPATLDLRARYKPLVFIMLYVGKLSYDCDLPVVLNAARIGLRNPHIGLIVLGEGPARRDLEKQTEVLNIKEQVIFEPKIKDIIPYLKSANVLLVPDTDLDSESLVLQGAASGIPMIMARTPAREDVFRDGESALFCSADNVDEFSLKLNILMNDIPLRRHMVELSQDMIRAKFHDNPAKYRNAYRDSIEQVLFIEQNKD